MAAGYAAFRVAVPPITVVLMFWLECLVALVLIFAGPVWDHFEVPRLKADASRKTPFYLQGIVSQWVMSAIVLGMMGRPLWNSPERADWITAHVPRSFVGGFLAGLVAVMILPFLGTLKPKGRAAIRKAFQKLEFLLPTTPAQDGWFALLCVTAGICEEWLFRGFLLHFLIAGPWHTPMGLAIILSAAVFGLNHLYQGLSGMITSAVLGALFAIIYVATGNLLLPMVLHALIDLRALGLLMASRQRSGDTVEP